MKSLAWKERWEESLSSHGWTIDVDEKVYNLVLCYNNLDYKSQAKLQHGVGLKNKSSGPGQNLRPNWTRTLLSHRALSNQGSSSLLGYDTSTLTLHMVCTLAASQSIMASSYRDTRRWDAAIVWGGPNENHGSVFGSPHSSLFLIIWTINQKKEYSQKGKAYDCTSTHPFFLSCSHLISD